MSAIPIVDFDAFLNGTLNERKQVSIELIQVVKKFGFVYLKNYGFPKGIVEKLFKLNQDFFDQSLEKKLTMRKTHETFCGYDALQDEKLTDDRPSDLKESYMLKQYGTPWPNDLPEFKEFMLDFHHKCYLLASEILRSFAIGLNLDQNIFESKFNKLECTIVRLLHYPPLPEQTEPHQIRAGEHTDYGALSILFQDSIGGLEVKSTENEWIPASYYDNTIIINVGDAMEMLTNGLLKSTLHRVVNPKDDSKQKSRYSVVFFCDPDLDAEIKCIEDFVSQDNPAKFSPLLYKEHLMKKLKATYPKLY